MMECNVGRLWLTGGGLFIPLGHKIIRYPGWVTHSEYSMWLKCWKLTAPTWVLSGGGMYLSLFPACGVCVCVSLVPISQGMSGGPCIQDVLKCCWPMWLIYWNVSPAVDLFIVSEFTSQSASRCVWIYASQIFCTGSCDSEISSLSLLCQQCEGKTVQDWA